MVWLAPVVLQVVTKAWAGGASDTPMTVTVTILWLLPLSKTLVPVAVTLTWWLPLLVGALLKASVEDPLTTSNMRESPPVPMP